MSTFTTLRQMIRRGSARLLVLKAVSTHPMHGYEVGKEISAMFDGTYVPRSGVIYPTLQSLEDSGYVIGSRVEDKTIYTITEMGKKYLKLNGARINEIIRYVQGRKDVAQFSILKSASRLQRTIVASLPEMTKKDKEHVSKILDDANAKIYKLAQRK